MINPYYIQRINLVIDHMDENCSDKLSLNQLAGIAMFSKYHFHRIFKAVTGETLNNYSKQLKMTKAFRLLQLDKSADIKEVAFRFGYNSIANFSRDFKEFHGFTPSEAKNKSLVSSNDTIKNNPPEISVMFRGIEYIPAQFIAFIKITSGYQPEIIAPTFDKLYKTALEKNFLITRFLGIGYDDPDFTPAGKCRYDACIVLNPEKTPNDIGLNTKTIKGGNYAVFYFEGYKENIALAWDYIFKEWLLKSSFTPTDKPHLEMYLPSEEYEKGIFKVNLCLPVKLIGNKKEAIINNNNKHQKK